MSKEGTMEVKTFEEWNVEGFRIKRGSKAIARTVDGVPLFSEDQVYVPERRIPRTGYGYTRRGYVDFADYDYDDPLLYDNWMGK